MTMHMALKIQCKFFKDNSGEVELANKAKMRPQMKHFTAKYHCFRQYVIELLISI